MKYYRACPKLAFLCSDCAQPIRPRLQYFTVHVSARSSGLDCFLCRAMAQLPGQSSAIPMFSSWAILEESSEDDGNDCCEWQDDRRSRSRSPVPQRAPASSAEGWVAASDLQEPAGPSSVCFRPGMVWWAKPLHEAIAAGHTRHVLGPRTTSRPMAHMSVCSGMLTELLAKQAPQWPLHVPTLASPRGKGHSLKHVQDSLHEHNNQRHLFNIRSPKNIDPTLTISFTPHVSLSLYIYIYTHPPHMYVIVVCLVYDSGLQHGIHTCTCQYTNHSIANYAYTDKLKHSIKIGRQSLCHKLATIYVRFIFTERLSSST